MTLRREAPANTAAVVRPQASPGGTSSRFGQRQAPDQKNHGARATCRLWLRDRSRCLLLADLFRSVDLVSSASAAGATFAIAAG